MNSILDIHVQRERGQAVTLAPRLPSMFESASGLEDSAPVFEQSVPAAPLATAPHGMPEAPRPAPSAPMQPAREPLRRAAAPPPAPVAPAAAAPAQLSVAPPARRTPPAPAHVPGPQIVRIERETVLMPGAPVRKELTPASPAPRRAAAATPPAPVLPAAQPAVAAAAPAPLPAAPKIEVRPARAAGAGAVRPSTGQVVPAPQAVRVPASRRAPSLPAPVMRAPDVHITIGRIEVRATTAAPSRAARDNGAVAPMSLDQYLSQRNRKGNP